VVCGVGTGGSTVVLPVVTTLEDLFRAADWPCGWALAVREATEDALARGLPVARARGRWYVHPAVTIRLLTWP